MMEATIAELMESLAWHYEKMLKLKPQAAETEKAALRAAQDKWREFRDANCQAEAGIDFSPEGTAFVVAFMECMAAMTEQRVAELKSRYVAHVPVVF